MFTFLRSILKSHRMKVLFALGPLLLFPVVASSAEAPRTGGELVFAVGEIPPSFDGHRETTFGMLHPLAPHYSTLLRFDPQNFPKIVGDVAEKSCLLQGRFDAHRADSQGH